MRLAKLILFLTVLAVASYSAYAGCCLIDSGEKCNYYDFGSWDIQESFCYKLGVFFSFDTNWTSSGCSQPFIGRCVDAKTDPNPIIPNSNGGSKSGEDTAFYLDYLKKLKEVPCEDKGTTCADWSECADSEQERTCTKTTVCGDETTTETSTETQDCTMPKAASAPPAQAEERPQTEDKDNGLTGITGRAVTDIPKSSPWIAWLVIFVIVTVGIGVYFYFRKKK
jgi:hypothetical protein